MLLSSQVNTAALSAISSSVSLAERTKDYESNAVFISFVLFCFALTYMKGGDQEVSCQKKLCVIVVTYSVLSQAKARPGQEHLGFRLHICTTHEYFNSCYLELKGLAS